MSWLSAMPTVELQGEGYGMVTAGPHHSHFTPKISAPNTYRTGVQTAPGSFAIGWQKENDALKKNDAWLSISKPAALPTEQCGFKFL